MKLSAHLDDPHYHPIAVHVNVMVQSGRTILERCIYADTATGIYCCYKYPMFIDEETEVAAVYYDKDETLYFEFQDGTPQWLIDDWYKKLGFN